MSNQKRKDARDQAELLAKRCTVAWAKAWFCEGCDLDNSEILRRVSDDYALGFSENYIRNLGLRDDTQAGFFFRIAQGNLTKAILAATGDFLWDRSEMSKQEYNEARKEREGE